MKNWSDKYLKLQLLGQGSSGSIHKVMHKDTKEVTAAKIINISQDHTQLHAIELEVKIMAACAHHNILECRGVEIFQEEVWILLDYCEEGSLADIMKTRKSTFAEEDIADILGQVVEGLYFLHKRNIVHRDIKASNLLVKKGVVKIADFGVSSQCEGTTISEPKFSRIGSPFWMSPEILSESLYSSKADIWALGITAIELAEGQPPYSHQHPFRAIYSIQTHPPQGLQKPENWSKQFNSFIKMCLTQDYNARPSASQLLTHSFINKKIVFSLEQSIQQDGGAEEDDLNENTIIMHDQVPKSFWEKDSFPQTEEKLLQSHQEYDDTVVINENAPAEIILFSDLKKSLQSNKILSNRKLEINKENIISSMQISESVQEKDTKAKELFRMMEEEVKMVRRKFMNQIRQLYLPTTTTTNNNSKPCSRPLKKNKEKEYQLKVKEHSRYSSELLKKIL